MSIFDDIKESIENYLKDLTTIYNKSSKWKKYNIGIAKTHCINCLLRQNKIYEVGTEPNIPEHDRCVCFLTALDSVSIGQATKKGINGADFYLKHYGRLPDYYITKEEAENLGWKSIKGNLDQVAPGKMIGGNIFKNKSNLLPSAPGRIWYECDIDYQGGYRNNYRLVYSNDGLIFRTDSHYLNFIAVE